MTLTTRIFTRMVPLVALAALLAADALPGRLRARLDPRCRVQAAIPHGGYPVQIPLG